MMSGKVTWFSTWAGGGSRYIHSATVHIEIVGDKIWIQNDHTEEDLLVFVEHIGDEHRQQYEKDYADEKTGVMVVPVFIGTGK
ncbi:element excision factor XisI family protein [Desulfococcaceae bacterium HSG8]|nr:element excision factor XisI family protein [Desulfococcaceae bacterium HSG8]